MLYDEGNNCDQVGKRGMKNLYTLPLYTLYLTINNQISSIFKYQRVKLPLQLPRYWSLTTLTVDLECLLQTRHEISGSFSQNMQNFAKYAELL